jgi:hypothetical protein
VIIVHVPLDSEERSFYDALYQRSKRQFEGFAAIGAVMSKYAAIFALLLRLRRECMYLFLRPTTHSTNVKTNLLVSLLLPPFALFRSM